jgi:hypothetical protein
MIKHATTSKAKRANFTAACADHRTSVGFLDAAELNGFSRPNLKARLGVQGTTATDTLRSPCGSLKGERR